MPVLQSKCEWWNMMKFKIKMVQSRDSGEKKKKRKMRMDEVIISSAFTWKLSAQ